MADAAVESKAKENPAVEESSEVTDPPVAQDEVSDLVTTVENPVSSTGEENGPSEDTEMKEQDQDAVKETEDTAATEEAKMDFDNEADEFLELGGEHGFDADILDETIMDEEEAKDNHEGDGEPEDIKEDEEEEEEEEEEPDDSYPQISQDPNIMPQVNVAVLAQRKWQVKVYPLKPADFVSGHISRVFKHARESLLYLLSPGKNARGKGEMYLSSVNQTVQCVHSLMRMEYFHPEINIEVIKKNDEGAIEEKAYLRFDSKLTRILTMRPFRRGAAGRKDRLIGSVFVKNLPAGTTKDTLRVMFPFAQEINYNPEKFKDCTARLVLHYRSHVIPCLKAFAKVELGGNVLELHPLTKRKRTASDTDDMPEVKQKKKVVEPKKDGTPKKTDESSKARQPSGEKKDVPKKDSREKSEGRPKDEKKDFKKPPQNKKPRNPPVKSAGPQSQRKDQRGDNMHRPPLARGKERTSGSFGRNQAGKPPAGRGGRGRQDRPSTLSPRNPRDDRTRSREFTNSTRRFGNNRNSRPRGSGGNIGGRQSQSARGRSSYGMGSNLGLGASSLATSETNLAINAEATKEMVLLQNQLSMAIKNQLAMLNQTQMAVEQAKRGASSIGLGSDLQAPLSSRASPKGLGGSEVGSSRRSVDQYRSNTSLDDSLDRYSGRSPQRPKQQRRGGGGAGAYPKRGGGGSAASAYSKRGGAGGGAYPKRGGAGGGAYPTRGSGGSGSIGGGGGYTKRSGSSSYRDEFDWDRDLTSSQLHDPYSHQQDFYDRDSHFGASSRSSYNQDSGYSGGYF